MAEVYKRPQVNERYCYYEYDYCLTEMARRRMSDALARHYDHVLDRDKPRIGYDLDNIEPLTALRRAQGEPDPLTIHPSAGFGEVAVYVHATIENRCAA